MLPTFDRHGRYPLAVLFLLTLLVLTISAQSASAGKNFPEDSEFVQRVGPHLFLQGQPFRFAGANNYYLMYKSQFMVDDVLETAAESKFTVLRTWGFLDIGNEDGSNSTHGIQEGVYFHYWDGTGPAYNDGPDGLERLDYVIYKAGQEGIKLIIPLTNNWSAFGGMDQYVRWAEGQYHDEFYTDPMMRGWYKDWITHLLNRTNIYTGLQYKDDPTIMMWELGNEPRCKGSGLYPPSPDCSVDDLLAWADEISQHINSIDQNHLISVGDEGFYCYEDGVDWTEDCTEGVDTVAFAQLPEIDVLSYHLYPDHWSKDVAWSNEWIERHLQDARQIRKPSVLGEFGLQDKSMRNPTYKAWTDTIFWQKGSGVLYWMLAGYEDSGSYYPDYDGFTVYCPSPVCTTISNNAMRMTNNRIYRFPPVADHDTAVTEFETAVTLVPANNDVAYDAEIEADTIDLDPDTPAQELSRTVPGGTFTWQADETVLFTPEAGFAGNVEISYTIEDSRGQLSNEAKLMVTVLPSPTAPILMYSFETGTEGWAAGDWQTDAGSVAQSSAYATEGMYSLQVDTINGGWFGVGNGAGTDISGKTMLKIDLKTTGAGTSTNVALQLGDSWEWCQGAWGWVNPGNEATVEIDLLSLGCNNPDLSQVNGIWVWVSGSGTFYLDNVRAE